MSDPNQSQTTGGGTEAPENEQQAPQKARWLNKSRIWAILRWIFIIALAIWGYNALFGEKEAEPLTHEDVVEQASCATPAQVTALYNSRSNNLTARENSAVNQAAIREVPTKDPVLWERYQTELPILQQKFLEHSQTIITLSYSPNFCRSTSGEAALAGANTAYNEMMRLFDNMRTVYIYGQ